MNKDIKIIIGTWIVVILGVLLVMRVSAHDNNNNQCNANNQENCPSPVAVCDNGEHTGNPHCATPTPTDEPTASPSATPTSNPCDNVICTVYNTPTPEPTVAPTDQPKGGSGVSDNLGCGSHPCYDGHNIQPGISAYDGSPVGEK